MTGWLILLLLQASPGGTGLDTLWRTSPIRATGMIQVSAVADAILLQAQGGDSTLLDAATGARRTTLIDFNTRDAAIDPYATTARVLHGALVGPNKLDLAAIDLATGKVRWRHPFAGLNSPRDDYALRDTLSAVDTPAQDVVAVRHLVAGDADRWHWEETLAGLDPQNGKERWRRTVTSWPANTPIGARDGLQLAADGERVLVVKPGRVETFDARTGSPGWSRPWDGKLAPAFSSGRVALAEAGTPVVHVLDSASGHEVATLRGWHGVLDSLVFVGAALCAISTDDNQGHAACFALEADRVRELWHHQYSLPLTQALADSRALFVTVGGERLLTLDADSGAERWIASFPRWTQVWLAPDTKGRGRLFALDQQCALGYVAPGAAPARLPPYLRFVLDAAADGSCRLSAAEWIDGDDHRLWTSPLPARLRTSRGPCAEYELATYRRAPRHAVIPGLVTRQEQGAVWLADSGGLLALDPSNGKILFDADTAKGEPAKRLFFDDGRFTWGQCTGLAPGAQVFARCDDLLLYFDGSTALLVDLATRREKARASYGSSKSSSGGRAARVEARIRLGGRTLELNGIIYMR